MSAWVRYLELTAKSKTGLGSGVIVWALIAALGAAVTFGLIVFTAFIWLADRYDPLTAALVLCGFFLLVTVVAAVICVRTQRQTVLDAKLALAARANQPWLDPRYLMIGMQLGRNIGWRKVVPIAAAGLLVAGLAHEWMGRDKGSEDEPTEG
jgi:hypothetical protein